MEVEETGGKHLWESCNLTSVTLRLDDKEGSLNNALHVFSDHNIEMTSIQSKPQKHFKRTREVSFHIDFIGTLGQSNVQKALEKLRAIAVLDGLKINSPSVIPWFPTRLSDFDTIGKKILSEGDGIQDADHPGFRDAAYRSRREEINAISGGFTMDQEIPRVTYNDEERKVWKFCYDNLKDLFKEHACKEFNQTIGEFEKEVGFRPDEIPQLGDISNFLKSKTGWRLKPVGGLLTQREFLNGLAFKVFHSTQYIRHGSAPLYTPEPDIVHELLGHAPMFAHKPFGDFSQEIGLASLGATEIEISRLAAIYWFTIEFGMCRENDSLKAYGAGILSSVGELKYCVTDEPKHYDLDLVNIAQNHVNFPISSMQPYYFVAQSFEQAKQQIIDYTETIHKPFNVSYDETDHSMVVDRRIKTRLDTA